MSAGGLAKRFGLAGAAFAALAGTTAAGLWHQLFRRPLPRTRDACGSTGSSRPVEIRRDRWGVPHIRAADAATTCGSRRASATARTASGSSTSTAGSAPGGWPRSPAAEGLPTDRLMRTLGLRRAAEREAAALEPGAAIGARRATAPGSTRPPPTAPLPAEFQLLRIGFEPWRPPTRSTLAKLLAFGLSTNWERELLRAEMARELGAELAARLDPGYPRGNPVVLTPGEAWTGDGLGAGRADRARSRTRSASRSRRAARTTGRSAATRSATGGAAARRRPAPAAEHAGDHLPGRALPRATASAAGRRCRACPASIMGQNNDVAWTFTNAMADVMDLFVERIDGDTLRVRGRVAAAGADRGGDRGQGARGARAARGPRDPPRPDRQRGARRRRRRAAGAALDRPSTSPASRAASLGVLDVTSGAELVEPLGEHAHPVSNLVWADRHGSIGYKTVGRLPVRRGGCPDLPEARLDGRVRVGGLGPLRGAARAHRPGGGFLVTANNRIAPDDYPHHITSDYLDGYRARRIEQLIDAPSRSTTSRASRRCRPTCSRSRGSRPRAGWPGCGRATSASWPRSSGCASWDGRMEPRLDRGHDLPGVHAAAGARGRPGGDRRPRPGRALARPRRQRLHRPRHLALALAVAPAGALGGGRRGADRPALGRARARRAARRPRRPRRPLRARPGSLALGQGPPARLPARARRGEPPARLDLQPPARGRRRPGDGRPGRLGPERPVHGDLGAVLADGRRPGAPGALALAGVHRPVGPPGEPALRRPPGRLARGPDAADGRRGAVARADARARADEPPGPDQAHGRRAARAARVRARGRRRRRSARAAGRTRCRSGTCCAAARSGSTPTRSRRRSRTWSAIRARRCWSRPGTSTASCAASRSRRRPRSTATSSRSTSSARS